jgi:exonuclease III
MIQPKDRDNQTGLKMKQDSTICCLQEIHCSFKDPSRLKAKKRQELIHINSNPQQAGVAILMSDKTEFETRARKEKGEATQGEIKARESRKFGVKV